MYDGVVAEVSKIPRPQQAISDDIGVLDGHPEVRKRLDGMLEELKADFGFSIYVLIRPVWMGGSADDLSALLQQAWFPTGDGLVLVVETDNRRVGMGVALENRPDEDTWMIPTHISSALVSKVINQVDYELPTEEFLEMLVSGLADAHRDYFEGRTKRTPPLEFVKEQWFLLSLGAGLALIIVAVSVWTRYSRRKDKLKVFRFPVVQVPERLGAPFGGGQVVVRKFGPEN